MCVCVILYIYIFIFFDREWAFQQTQGLNLPNLFTGLTRLGLGSNLYSDFGFTILVGTQAWPILVRPNPGPLTALTPSDTRSTNTIYARRVHFLITPSLLPNVIRSNPSLSLSIRSLSPALSLKAEAHGFCCCFSLPILFLYREFLIYFFFFFFFPRGLPTRFLTISSCKYATNFISSSPMHLSNHLFQLSAMNACYFSRIENAHDRFGLGFILYMISHMGFGVKWRKWIEVCLKATKFYEESLTEDPIVFSFFWY